MSEAKAYNGALDASSPGEMPRPEAEAAPYLVLCGQRSMTLPRSAIRPLGLVTHVAPLQMWIAPEGHQSGRLGRSDHTNILGSAPDKALRGCNLGIKIANRFLARGIIDQIGRFDALFVMTFPSQNGPCCNNGNDRQEPNCVNGTARLVCASVSRWVNYWVVRAQRDRSGTCHQFQTPSLCSSR